MAKRPRKTNGPSLALSAIFAVLMTAIVVPVVGFVVSFSVGSQGGIDFFTTCLKWAFLAVGVMMAYGFAVGAYHTFLAITGLDRSRQNNG